MYTFLFISNIEEKLSQVVLRSCAKITKRHMPSFDEELVEGYTILPECNSGWFWLAPAYSRNFSLISEVIDKRYAVLVFGDIFDGSSNSAAQTVFDAWTSGGSPKIRTLEGCFSAVIVDRTDGAVVLIGDLTGRRALMYHASGGTLIVSPHDVPLMATGRIPVEFDYVSVCSVTAVQWSLKGRSLLRHVHTCHPSGYTRWSDSRIQHVADPVIHSDQRIPKEDFKAVSRLLDQMIETAQANARIFVANKPEFRCDLSAGFDSRVVFSLLLSVIDDPSRIIATTWGEANSEDIQVAHRLAKMYGTRFSSFVEVPPPPDDFIARCDLLAFAMNGGTPGKRAMKYPSGFTRHPKTYASGSGGEIFRGFFYPHSLSLSPPSLSPTNASQILRKHMLIDRLPWKSPELAGAVLDRLNTVVNDYAAFSANGFDILDMFYLYERMGVWGAATARQTWKDPRWSPFMSIQMIRMAYMMPAPIAHFAAIHRESLRRFAPGAYWIPINGTKLAPLEGRGSFLRLLNEINGRYHHNLGRVLRALRFGRPASTNKTNKTMDELVVDFLAGPLLEKVREILLSDGSFSLEIFGRQGVDSLLNEHKSRKANHVEVLGFLTSMERWRTMIHGAARDAANVSPR
jgi:hypothetical protein